jgi:hypothetical protein
MSKARAIGRQAKGRQPDFVVIDEVTRLTDADWDRIHRALTEPRALAEPLSGPPWTHRMPNGAPLDSDPGQTA